MKRCKRKRNRMKTRMRRILYLRNIMSLRKQIGERDLSRFIISLEKSDNVMRVNTNSYIVKQLIKPVSS